MSDASTVTLSAQFFSGSYLLVAHAYGASSANLSIQVKSDTILERTRTGEGTTRLVVANHTGAAADGRLGSIADLETHVPAYIRVFGLRCEVQAAKVRTPSDQTRLFDVVETTRLVPRYRVAGLLVDGIQFPSSPGKVVVSTNSSSNRDGPWGVVLGVDNYPFFVTEDGAIPAYGR
jgi:hypothetical protein